MHFINLLIICKEDKIKIQTSNTGYFKGKLACDNLNCNHYGDFCRQKIHGYGTLITLNNSKFNAHWKYGKKQLSLLKNQKKYNDNRNDMSITTTLLSAYIKFGNI